MKKAQNWLAPQCRDGIKTIRVVDRYTKGYSDLFICARGRFVVAELKDSTRKATPHQLLFIEEMQRAGAIGGVCRSIKDIANLLNQALYCSCNISYPTSYKYCPSCGKELYD